MWATAGADAYMRWRLRLVNLYWGSVCHNFVSVHVVLCAYVAILKLFLVL